MARTSAEPEVFRPLPESGLGEPAWETRAVALRRLLFLYAGLTATALPPSSELALASVSLGGVPHSLRRRAFFHACALSLRQPAPEPTRIRVR
jgi:hypothetical protein